ncbi:MAG: hypothetical protein ACHP7E_01645, partial [Burkholderiales bacterium]
MQLVQVARHQCLLRLLELGVPRSRIECQHHLVDGREGSTLMDWPVTESYCTALCQALGVPLTFSWREGGIEREAAATTVPRRRRRSRSRARGRPWEAEARS